MTKHEVQELIKEDENSASAILLHIHNKTGVQGFIHAPSLESEHYEIHHVFLLPMKLNTIQDDENDEKPVKLDLILKYTKDDTPRLVIAELDDDCDCYFNDHYYFTDDAWNLDSFYDTCNSYADVLPEPEYMRLKQTIGPFLEEAFKESQERKPKVDTENTISIDLSSHVDEFMPLDGPPHLLEHASQSKDPLARFLLGTPPIVTVDKDRDHYMRHSLALINIYLVILCTTDEYIKALALEFMKTLYENLPSKIKESKYSAIKTSEHEIYEKVKSSCWGEDMEGPETHREKLLDEFGLKEAE